MGGELGEGGGEEAPGATKVVSGGSIPRTTPPPRFSQFVCFRDDDISSFVTRTSLCSLVLVTSQQSKDLRKALRSSAIGAVMMLALV